MHLKPVRARIRGILEKSQSVPPSCFVASNKNVLLDAFENHQLAFAVDQERIRRAQHLFRADQGWRRCFRLRESLITSNRDFIPSSQALLLLQGTKHLALLV